MKSNRVQLTHPEIAKRTESREAGQERVIKIHLGAVIRLAGAQIVAGSRQLDDARDFHLWEDGIVARKHPRRIDGDVAEAGAVLHIVIGGRDDNWDSQDA